MADKIKQFFQKKKADAKFRKAGPGHKLTESKPTTSQKPTQSSVTVTSRTSQSEESRQAAAAALARLGGQKSDTVGFNTSLAAIRAQVKRELENEKKSTASDEDKATPAKESFDESSPYLAVSGVYFKCPLIGPEILSKDEWNVKIKEFLYDQLEDERGLTAVLIIHTLNKNKEKVEQCVDTLCKYLENIIQHPDEEKYHKIRMSNKVFQERVAPLEGTKELLLAAGFETTTLPHQDKEEEFLVFHPEKVEGPDTLQILCDALRSAEPIGLELDRNMKVLLPSQAAVRTELPPVFFTLSVEELKREQQLRSEAAEKSLMLRTKAMREKDEQRELKKYRYALIRIRFPDGILLQGTFSVYEKLEAVIQFVSEHLEQSELPFLLSTPTGHKLTAEDNDKTLLDLRLIPAVILTFSWEQAAVNEVTTDQPPLYLKPEVMVLVEEL